ncbi:retron St85 family RNA-directed DNA polymerase [Dysgonomonas sp. 511]|uniref:retron St85 family RNA-directed DNA polymerase n=1 Tax=Dysgonomonas sp. 511 TaxID=2302930 RepID=UPI0013D81F0A|nr:retron St85 family RNA-directed DNA polymerase [Dysgonomonas sp. 511]NDV78318.1 RNA-directed DNA polymerase [Dysgonomonas sp. 511]
MDILIYFAIAIIIIWAIFKLLNYDNSAEKDKTRINNKPQSPGLWQRITAPHVPYDNQSLSWCSKLLAVDVVELKKILAYRDIHYKSFRIGKRSGGYRTISAPNEQLLNIQKTIYNRILLPVGLHPAATGFRKDTSIKDNAKPHLGKRLVLKMDIVDFFGSIHEYRVRKIFQAIGYPVNVSDVLAALCCLRQRLPQGAPTSPALSNIAALEMDKKLAALATKYNLTYSRYADDMTFSGDEFEKDKLIKIVTKAVQSENFAVKRSKTRYMGEKQRKIVTGISISSGEKMTIPKSKKRQVRQQVHYILTRGLDAHQRHIGNNDPAYLKRLVGYLNFWLSVEPENRYVRNSIKALAKIKTVGIV